MFNAAEKLRQPRIDGISRKVSKNTSETQVLEEFWDGHRMDTSGDQGEAHAIDPLSVQTSHRNHLQTSPNGQVRKRNRAVSSASALAPPGQLLSPHHPALSLPKLLNTFGPLIFPLYKAALLRKRVLLVGQPPVEMACNYGIYQALSKLDTFIDQHSV